jgi:hypothetical protein
MHRPSPPYGRRSSEDHDSEYNADNLQADLQRWKEQWQREIEREQADLHRKEQAHFLSAEMRAVEKAGQSIFHDRTIGEVYRESQQTTTTTNSASTVRSGVSIKPSVMSSHGSGGGSSDSVLARFRARKSNTGSATNDSQPLAVTDTAGPEASLLDMLYTGSRFRIKGAKEVFVSLWLASDR